MKKIFTLIAATVLTVASFAADRPPVVTLNGNRNFEVMIDGQRYTGYGNQQINLMRGQSHQVKVFDVSRGGFGMFNMRNRRLVDASTFSVGRGDVAINIDPRGQIRISQDRQDWFGDRDGRGDDQRNSGWNNSYGNSGYGHDGAGHDKGYHDNR